MKKMLGIISLLIISVMIILKFSLPNKNSMNIEEPVFWILSDTHLITSELHDEGDEFERIKKTSAGKELDYQEESLVALVDKALEEKPTGIIITGDLTLNGERKSAEKLAEILEPLVKSGIKYYVIPGNHDIYDGWAREFKGNTVIKTEQISPKNFETIFKWSYENSNQKDPNSLSYGVSVNDKTQFIMLDTNIYGKLPGTTVPQTKGKLKEETFLWIEKQLKKGEEKGQKAIVFMHHNLLQHNSLINEGFVIEDNDKLKRLLHDFDVPLVFSGHTHAQSIKTDSETGISEVVTASYSITEQTYGEIKFSKDKISYEKKRIDVDKWARKNNMQDNNLLNYQEYTKNLFIEDGKKMAYVQLIESGIYDEEKLDTMAEFVGEANWTYFTGNQVIANRKARDIKEEEGYKLIEENSVFLLDYMNSIIETYHQNNNYLEISTN